MSRLAGEPMMDWRPLKKMRIGTHFLGPPLLLLFSLLFTSCKEKAMNLVFTWDGVFAHEFLVSMIDNPPENFKPDSAMPGGTTVDTFEFFGVTMDEMRTLLKQFGDCELHLKLNLTVELNGFKVTKLYVPTGAWMVFNFKSQNKFPEIVYKTADVVIEEYPNHDLKFAQNGKSLSYTQYYQKPFIIFDSADTKEEMDLGSMGKSKQEGVKLKLKDGKVYLNYKDPKTPTTMNLVLERVKQK